jgi:hypothetical protein
VEAAAGLGAIDNDMVVDCTRPLTIVTGRVLRADVADAFVRDAERARLRHPGAQAGGANARERICTRSTDPGRLAIS